MEQGDLLSALGAIADAVERRLDLLLAPVEGPEAPVVEAMRYACLGGGKRLRPFLVVQSAALFDVPEDQALNTAAALEMLHCYSLAHDDLPAMDDSDLRRGRPTLHKAFDEATAILAGDGLLTEGFAVLARPSTHPDPAVRAELVAALATAAGAGGMVGGQMIDIAAERDGLALDLEGIKRLQAMKTGALIGFACTAGAILGRAGAGERQALANFAADLGLAFQIKDDLLDWESSAAELGKPTGQDAAAQKATFVQLLGLEGARAQSQKLSDRAAAHLEVFGEKAKVLVETARFVVERRA
jgi:farnesyl diphosphate synthase